MAAEGRRSVVLVFGTVFTLAIAGTIEGFVTGSSLPTAVRVGIGGVVEAAFLTYAVMCGRAARRAGFTGALGEAAAGWSAEAGDRTLVATAHGETFT